MDMIEKENILDMQPTLEAHLLILRLIMAHVF